MEKFMASKIIHFLYTIVLKQCVSNMIKSFLNNLHTDLFICSTGFPVLYLQHGLTYIYKSIVHVHTVQLTGNVAGTCTMRNASTRETCEVAGMLLLNR